MKRLVHGGATALGSLVALTMFVACGGGDGAVGAAKTATAPGGSKDPSSWPADDRSMCEWRNKPEVEVSETAGTGALKPNVRRVYKVFGELEQHHKTLICREVDTNLDGIKDVARKFNAKGEPTVETADRDFDGMPDVWIQFVDGRIAQEDVDTNKDGKPDVWKFYVNGSLQRIRRDRNFDGKPDVWEIYTKGRLERIGYDESYDGHVDRWDRDEQLKYEAEAKERETLAAMAAAADGGAPPPSGGADAGAAK